ncbi:MAG: MauE/DoxX family redox-associated membrane protein [Gemmatimonadaceae bacterium]|nr:MauE/DoxX family redox-associated membrane protein [Gemmatimonadaceae bacterium]
MSLLTLLARFVLAVVFGAAGLAKLADRTKTRTSLAAFGVPRALVGAASLALPVAELAIVVLLLGAPTAWWGGAAALGLLIAFTVVIAANLARGRKPPCHCFGQLHSRPVGSETLLRNAALAGCAALVVWPGPGRPQPEILRSLSDATALAPAAVVIIACAAALCIGQSVLIWQLFRQHGRLLLRMDRIERSSEAAHQAQQVESLAALEPLLQGLPVGTTAPPFELATPSRGTLSLGALLQERRPVMLIFSDPDCGACTALLPEVQRWQVGYADKIRIAVVSRGSDHAVRMMAKRHDLTDVLLQTDREVAQSYNVQAIPSAVLIRVDGQIGSSLMLGRDAIEQLLQLDTVSLDASASASYSATSV